MVITANSKENYAAIEDVLTAIDPTGKMFEEFLGAYKDEDVDDQLVVVLKAKDKPRKDLNHARYQVDIPSTLTVTNVEVAKAFSAPVNPCKPRNPIYTLKVIATCSVDNAVVVLAYTGFTDPCIFVNVYPVEIAAPVDPTDPNNS